MAIEAEIQTALNNIFGVGGANLNAERTTVKVNDFSGLDTEDPIDWLKTFERAATTNRWTDEARKVAIAGGLMKGSQPTGLIPNLQL